MLVLGNFALISQICDVKLYFILFVYIGFIKASVNIQLDDEMRKIVHSVLGSWIPPVASQAQSLLKWNNFTIRKYGIQESQRLKSMFLEIYSGFTPFIKISKSPF